MRSTHRCLGLDGPGPSGFNERIHKKQVLPYIGSSQNYLFPVLYDHSQILTPPKVLGSLFSKGPSECLKSKKYFSSKSPCKQNINWNHPKSLPASYDVHPGFTFPNYHQINMLTIIFCHQLHYQTQISADFVLAPPFATIMNAITVKWFNQTEDMD